MLIIVMLVYTASYVPYEISYIDDEQTSIVVFDIFQDVVFFIDLILTFFSAYEDKLVGIEVRHKKIAVNYLKSWFFIDLLSW